MTDPVFVLNNSNTPQNDSAWISALQEALASAVAGLVPGSGESVFLDIVVGGIASGGTQYSADVINLEIKYTNDDSQIKIGDVLYPHDVVVDSAVTSVATLGILALAGIAATSAWGLAIAGGIGYVYSKFVDPITEETLLALDGQDEIQIFDDQSALFASMIYRDGIASTGSSAVQNLIIKANEAGLDATGATVKLHTSIWPALEYKVTDGTVFGDMASKLGVSLSNFLTTSTGDYANNAFYVVGLNSETYAFSARSSGDLDQYLAIPVIINSQSQVINVGTVYNSAGNLVWGDNQNGDNGVRLKFGPSDGGTISGGVGHDLLFGSSGVDVITVNDSVTFYASDTIIGGGGNDVLTGGYTSDLIDGGADNDVIRSSAVSGLGSGYEDIGVDTIYGGGGNDTIWGSSENDYINGGSGVDLLDYSESDDNITVDLHNKAALIEYELLGVPIGSDLQAVHNIEKVTTGSGDDILFGDSGNNTLDGGAGEDKLDGRAGTDSLIGGTGDDTFILHSTNAGLTTINDTTGVLKLGDVTLAGGASQNDAISTQWDFGQYTLTKVNSDADLLMTNKLNAANQILLEDFTNGDYGITLRTDGVSGTAGDDYIQVASNSNYNGVYRWDGGPIYLGPASNAVVYGGAGDDYIEAADLTGNITFYGGAGNDVMRIAANDNYFIPRIALRA